MDNSFAIGILAMVAGILTLFTIIANLLVIIAFKINRKLRTLSNYCLVSLAVSDLTVGIFLMPVYTVYLLIGYWPLGTVACNIWLSMDYALCTASLANLLIIAVDRHLSVTRPLTYRAKRTPRKMGMMIASAWIISFLIWPPWIFAWPYIEGKHIVPINECFVHFIKSNPIMTTVASCLSFYIPAIVTLVLYVILLIRTEQRIRRRKALALSFLALHNTSGNEGVNKPLQWCLCCRFDFGNERYNFEESREHQLQVIGKTYQLDGEKDRISNNSTCQRNDIEKTEDSHNNPNTNYDTLQTASKEQQQIQPSHGSESSLHKISKNNCSRDISYSQPICIPCQQPINSEVNHWLNSGPNRRHDGRIAKILSATLLSLIITNAPYYTVAVVASYCNGCVDSMFYGIVYWMCYINSTVNPLLYALCNVNFQRTFLKILRCKWK